MKPRTIFIIAVACVAALSFAVLRLRAPSSGRPVWQGYADADYVKVGPTLAGALTAVPVKRGQTIARGTLLFEQDDGDERAALEQTRRQLSQAEEVLANLQAAGKPTEIEQAKANLADLAATREKALADLARGEKLLPTGAASVQSVDQLHAAYDSAQAKVQGSQAALAQALAPLGRPGEIAAQQAAVQADKAALEMAQWRLDQRRMSSPVAGVVDDVIAMPGETLAAGAPVVSILAPENMLVRFFVPEPELAGLHPGDKVDVGCDRCATITARVSYVSPQAEYTPPFIYSESSRQKFVFMVEARPSLDQAMALHPGEPLDVRPVESRAR